MYYFIGILFLIGGIFINYTVGKRRFNRRGPGGLQHYNTYRDALFNTFFEKLAKLIGWALIILGLGFLALGYSQQDRNKSRTTNSASVYSENRISVKS